MPYSKQKAALVDVLAPGYIESNATKCVLQDEISAHLGERTLVVVFSPLFCLQDNCLNVHDMPHKVDKAPPASAPREGNLVDIGEPFTLFFS